MCWMARSCFICKMLQLRPQTKKNSAGQKICFSTTRRETLNELYDFTIEFDVGEISLSNTHNSDWYPKNNFFLSREPPINNAPANSSDRLKETNETESRKCFNTQYCGKKKTGVDASGALRISQFIFAYALP